MCTYCYVKLKAIWIEIRQHMVFIAIFYAYKIGFKWVLDNFQTFSPDIASNNANSSSGIYFPSTMEH